ncbi:uncharacterized protein [Mytilus edulis]|uniref:uncharacterized protein isoform X1 n=2 Tax=Mytilus edulis TaxID=6550 RepID=UPI0039F088BF
MSSSRTSRRKSDRKSKSRSAKAKKNVEVVDHEIETYEDARDVFSSILEETHKSDEKIDDEIISIASDTLLCLEEVYCDSNSTQDMSPIGNWGSEMNTISLVIGGGDEAVLLKSKIQQLTNCHEIQICKQEESFELCNNKGFVLVWLLIDMPVGPDILSLTTSIRYASKCNRGTVIIGVANDISSVDLRRHGIDEIVLEPVEEDLIRQKYSKWTSITIIPDLDGSEMHIKELPSSSENPGTPMSPSSTICAEQPTRGGFSISVDNKSGQLSLAQLGGLNIMKCMTTQINGQQNEKLKQQSANDHTTKEKVRRERIKDSCDQLRVLLPYIRGRKTDMASILEMCVDFIKLVNAALPQDFQNQITDILARDSSTPESPTPSKKKKSKKEEADSNTVSSTVDTDINNNEMKTEPGYVQQYPTVGIKDNDPFMSSKSTKRFLVQADKFLSSPPPTSCISNALTLSQYEPPMSRPGSAVMDQQQSSYSYNTGPHAFYNEYDIQNFHHRTFNSHEAYPNAFFGSPLASKQTGIDRDAFGMCMEPQPYYQFYGSNAICPYNMPQMPDYVNPNAVLPVNHNKSTHSTTYDESNLLSQHNPLSSEEIKPLEKL